MHVGLLRSVYRERSAGTTLVLSWRGMLGEYRRYRDGGTEGGTMSTGKKISIVAAVVGTIAAIATVIGVRARA